MEGVEAGQAHDGFTGTVALHTDRAYVAREQRRLRSAELAAAEQRG